MRAPGTNCDTETAWAFEAAGAVAERVHINRLIETPGRLRQFQILCIPGGFSYGDDVAAGRILAVQIQHHLADLIAEFHARENLILGICNGFQVLLKSGVLVPFDPQIGPPATLTWSDLGRYDDRWVYLRVDGEQSVFLRGCERLYLPVAHAEGKFVARDEKTLDQLRAAGLLSVRYALADGDGVVDEPLPFPANPNGSQANVAGMSDATGRILGLMPHPERNLFRTHHPHWSREEARLAGCGRRLFANAVEYFA